MCVHTLSHIQIFIHTHTHMDWNTYMHAQTHKYTHSHMCVHKHIKCKNNLFGKDCMQILRNCGAFLICFFFLSSSRVLIVLPASMLLLTFVVLGQSLQIVSSTPESKISHYFYQYVLSLFYTDCIIPLQKERRLLRIASKQRNYFQAQEFTKSYKIFRKLRKLPNSLFVPNGRISRKLIGEARVLGGVKRSCMNGEGPLSCVIYNELGGDLKDGGVIETILQQEPSNLVRLLN